MGTLFQILGGIAFVTALLVIPNVRDSREWITTYMTFGIAILIVGLGLVIRRFERLQQTLEARNHEKPAAETKNV